MAREIDIDIEDLKRFMDVLEEFHDKAYEQLKDVNAAWQICDQTWKGDSKDMFTKGFEQTKTAAESAIEAGQEASEWLEKLYDILRRFERMY